ncbi:MAG TPA: arginase family protein [Thermomicrobiales bacterium]|nr:arginase family protein [Thermomicrobiales bacterium]
MKIDMVTVPYRYDRRGDGAGQGPDALLAAGLLERLARAGVSSSVPAVAELTEDERATGSIAVNVGRLGAHTAELVATSRAESARVLVLSGDDTAMVGVVSGLQRAHGADAKIGLVWLDAHGDFNTPDTSYSGILAGMPVAILAGLAGPLWRGAAGLTAPIATDRIVISGVRELDEREETLLNSTDVSVVRGHDVTGHERAIDRLARTCDILCLHIDLDVLDPALVPSSGTPEPGGMTIAEAARFVKVVTDTDKVAVVSIAGLNPGAGQRGRKSTASTLELIEAVVPGWVAESGNGHANA